MWLYVAVAAVRLLGFRPLLQAHLDGIPLAIRAIAEQPGKISRTEYKLKVRGNAVRGDGRLKASTERAWVR